MSYINPLYAWKFPDRKWRIAPVRIPYIGIYGPRDSVSVDSITSSMNTVGHSAKVDAESHRTI